MDLLRLSDTELILLILAAFYLMECVCWVRRGAVCVSGAWRWFRPLSGPDSLSNNQGGLVLTNPLPWASSYVCEWWPGEVGREGWRFAADQEPIPFAEMKRIAASDGRLLINGRTVAEMASPAHAESLAAVLRRIIEAPAIDRPRVVETLLAESTNVEAVRARLQEVREATAALRINCSMLCLLVFACGPALYYVSSFSVLSLGLWLYLGLCLLYWLLAVLGFRRAHRRLFPSLRADRRKRVAMMCFSPAGAMRSAESVGRHALSGFHPLAVVAVVCRRPRLEAFAARTLLELKHPVSELAHAVSDDGESFRSQLLARVESVIRTAGIDPESLVQPPEPDPDAQSYCPRCQAQYVLPEGLCEPCGGIPLQAFQSERQHSTVEHEAERSGELKSP